jgi:hypothetical protein
MAPYNVSDDAHSRFSCETCHHEGYVDGRRHHTGRQDVHATTKPLLGLFNKRPYFSRGLDPDLARVSHAEFRVAGAGSGKDPWRTLDLAERPWLARLAGATKLDPLAQRRALMMFLMAFNHRDNPLTRGRERFSEDERRGAELFADRCVSCHAARLVADDPASEVPIDRWEAMIFERGAMVWGSDGYHRTGVEPYVHERGAIATSLRRLYKKRPYFTNGSAASLDEVLARARDNGDAFTHDGPKDAARAGASLSDEERRGLLAFLRLL